MKRHSQFFLTGLLLIVASVSWAACPEGTEQTYKGCEPTESLLDVRELFRMYEMEGPDAIDNVYLIHFGKLDPTPEEIEELPEEQLRELSVGVNKAILKENMLWTFMREMCPDSPRQTNDGC